MIEIPPTNAWLGENAVIAQAMQEVARDAKLWSRYQGLTSRQRAAFREAIALPIVIPLDRVLGMANGARRLTPRVPAAAPPRTTQVPPTIFTPKPAFLHWLKQQASISATRVFKIGASHRLDDDTISVAIGIWQSGSRVAGFVFHHHRDAGKPRIGHPEASEGHFKPGDGGDVRVYQGDVRDNATLRNLWNNARAKARLH